MELLTTVLCFLASVLMGLQNMASPQNPDTDYANFLAEPTKMYPVYFQGAVAYVVCPLPIS